MPNEGPFYLEGRLVLSLSFRETNMQYTQPIHHTELLERYRLWDDLAQTWFNDDLEVLRFENVDVVVRTKPTLRTLWTGALNTQARVIVVPDLCEKGLATNAAHDLSWRSV